MKVCSTYGIVVVTYSQFLCSRFEKRPLHGAYKGIRFPPTRNSFRVELHNEVVTAAGLLSPPKKFCIAGSQLQPNLAVPALNGADFTGNCSGRKRRTARDVLAMNKANVTSCASANGSSDCVGASSRSVGIF